MTRCAAAARRRAACAAPSLSASPAVLLPQKYTKCPIDLQQLQLEIVISEDSERDVQRQSLQRVAEEVDDRDWRARAPASADDAGWARAPGQQQGGGGGGGERAPERERGERAGPAPPQQQQQQQQGGGGSAPPQQQQQQQGGQQQQQWQGKELPKIQRAEDLGRQKYVVGAAVEGTERVSVGTVAGQLRRVPVAMGRGRNPFPTRSRGQG
jgi:hypothetical protein